MHDTKVTLIWHRKSTFESTKMEQVDKLLLLQAAYLEDIITVTMYKWCCCTYILLIRVHSYSISARTNSIRAHTNSIRARTYSIRARINSLVRDLIVLERALIRDFI